MLMDDQALTQAVLDHIAAGSTDTGTGSWREPVEHYVSRARFDEELRALRALPAVLCPSAALAEPGAYVAREALGASLLAVRDLGGQVRVFRNACRHRGMEVARGTGCTKALACPYHGWTYGLDGGLRHVPHADGFPDVERSDRGLVEVGAVERHGLVFVNQDGPATLPEEIHEIDGLLAPEHAFAGVDEQTEPANWKILTETFLEGLHIRFLHRSTFFPVQYDNTNVVERFGPHSRVTFPYRAVTRLADRPPSERSIEGKLTLVHHLFPNAVVATFPGLRLLFVLEPLAPDETRIVTYAFSTSGPTDAVRPPGDRATGERPLLLDGGDEDFDAARSVQRGLATGANAFLEFGLYESAIGHFHHHLDRAVERIRQEATA